MTPEGAKPAAPLTRAEIRHLDRQLVSGFAWTAGAKWSLQLASWASMLVLARLLDAADFGIVSMGALLFEFVSLASQFGIDGAMVRFKDMGDEQMRQLNTLAVLLGFVGFLLCASAAEPMALYFRTPALAQVIPVMACSFVITGFRVVPFSRLEREMRFRAISGIEVLQSIAQAATGITCAFLGFRYWSLIFGNLAGAMVGTALPIVLRATGYSRPSLASIGSLVSFSWKLLVSRLSWYGYSNADFLIVGRVLGQSALGVYSLAWNIAYLPIEKIVALLMRVTPTILAKAQNDRTALRRYYGAITGVLALVVFPLTIGLALVAADAIPLLLGQKWTVAVVPIQLLCCSVAIRLLSVLPGQLIQVLNDMRFGVIYGLATLLILPLGFYYSCRWGIAGVASVWICLYPITSAALIGRVLARLKMPVREVLGLLWTPALACALMAGVVTVVRAGCQGLPGPGRLAIAASTGTVVYAAVAWQSIKARVALFREILSPRAAA
jgi:O-antigen/teichoic acid export membrane protein